VVVGEVDVQDLMAAPGQLPAQLDLKGVPAEFVDKDAHAGISENGRRKRRNYDA
jgi:hypothetical protein